MGLLADPELGTGRSRLPANTLPEAVAKRVSSSGSHLAAALCAPTSWGASVAAASGSGVF